MTDPRNDASRPSSNATWGWIAGITIIVLIAIIVIAGWNTETDTASNAPTATAPIQAPSRTPLATTPPASTTGAAPMTPSTAPVQPDNR
jgi:hypothetical protein